MARKKTKAEALENLAELKGRSSPAYSRLPKRAKMVTDAAFLGAAGLIMLDPLNRLADERIVLPLDMVCIPAYQAYMIQGSPSMQIYVRAGETIIPTGGNVKDVAEALETEATHLASMDHANTMPQKNRRSSPYQRAYKKAFNQLAPNYKLKNGKWKKGGFRACVKAAHKKAGGKK